MIKFITPEDWSLAMLLPICSLRWLWIQCNKIDNGRINSNLFSFLLRWIWDYVFQPCSEERNKANHIVCPRHTSQIMTHIFGLYYLQSSLRKSRTFGGETLYFDRWPLSQSSRFHRDHNGLWRTAAAKKFWSGSIGNKMRVQFRNKKSQLIFWWY